ncbi:MAG: hypothetical protein ACU0DK_17075 [Pseudooceanicola sp.]
MSKAKDMRDEAARAADDLRDDLGHRAQDAAAQARETAHKVADDARAAAYGYGTDAKNHAADETSKIARALRGAADDLQDGSIQERLVGRLAENVADAADGLRSNELEQLGRDASAYARANPALFLGGAALLGFAAGRFLKATDRDGHDHDGGAPYSAVDGARPEDFPRSNPVSAARAEADPAGPLHSHNEHTAEGTAKHGTRAEADAASPLHDHNADNPKRPSTGAAK